MAELMPSGFVIRGTTFMSGTRFADDHVHYELNTATWMGPFEPTNTPFELVRRIGCADQCIGTESRGAARCASGAVVEADLQRFGE